MMIIRKYNIIILTIKIIKSTLNSEDVFNSNHNNRLIINDKEWNGYDILRIDDIGDWLIQKDFIGMKDHYNTLFYGIHTLELILN